MANFSCKEILGIGKQEEKCRFTVHAELIEEFYEEEGFMGTCLPNRIHVSLLISFDFNYCF